MKKILCFGDSNTYGFNPKDGSRYSELERWSALLKNMLKENYELTEAGCNDRTGFCPHLDGSTIRTGFLALEEFKNFDIVILAIGINDMQFFYNPSESEIKNGLERLIKIVKKNSQNAKIIIASPSKLNEYTTKGYFSCQFNEESVKKSHKLAPIYNEVAKESNCIFIDFDNIALVSDIDGLHYSIKSHKKIADALFKLITNNLDFDF